jgi:DNA-binding NarL/FixJ family response regulator
MIPKECLLCPQIIRPNFVVCRKHMPEYKEYGQSPWFKELVSMQNRQTKINNMESYSIDHVYTIKEVHVKSAVRKNKPQTIPHAKVIEMKEQGMRISEIARILDAKPKTIQKIVSRKWKSYDAKKRMRKTSTKI